MIFFRKYKWSLLKSFFLVCTLITSIFKNYEIYDERPPNWLAIVLFPVFAGIAYIFLFNITKSNKYIRPTFNSSLRNSPFKQPHPIYLLMGLTGILSGITNLIKQIIYSQTIAFENLFGISAGLSILLALYFVDKKMILKGLH